jgi:hypothetical protein
MATKHQARSEALKKSVAADKARLQAHSKADVMDDRQRGASSPLGTRHEPPMIAEKAKGKRR